MPDTIKSLIDGLDKITDILNIGRLLFYTAAGWCALLPASMCILLLGRANMTHPYWVDFMSDLVNSSRHYQIWIAGMIFGFIIAVVGNARIDFTILPGEVDVNEQYYPYQYPRLYSGGVRLKDGTKDYAAWVISEYYRYFEIALFVPYGLLLSLPVYALYSLIYLVRAASNVTGFTLGAQFYAFPMWSFATVLCWTVLWPDFWIPAVVRTTFVGWISAKRNLTEGLQEFIKDTDPTPQPPDASKTKG